eukprot:9861304-Karenia_brevis.AAC.1
MRHHDISPSRRLKQPLRNDYVSSVARSPGAHPTGLRDRMGTCLRIDACPGIAQAIVPRYDMRTTAT